MSHKYNDFFFTSNSSSSKRGKELKVLSPELIADFFKLLLKDDIIDDDIKLIIGLMFSGGLRVSEALSIKRNDIKISGEDYIITTKVLKKRNDKIRREILLYPFMIKLMTKKLKSKRYNEYLFKPRKEQKGKVINRFMINTELKNIFGCGVTPHSFRHSNVSFLLTKNLTNIKIATLLKMSVKNVENYAHVDAPKTMKGLFID